jgi:predicted RNase H-like HicB family nuclease
MNDLDVKTLREQRAAALSYLAELRDGERCHFDGEDVTEALIARMEANIQLFDKLIESREMPVGEPAES